jgi:hypothetical protein
VSPSELLFGLRSRSRGLAVGSIIMSGWEGMEGDKVEGGRKKQKPEDRSTQ